MNLDPAQRTHQGHAAVTTLRDVARAAGVSIASASRALAGQRVGTEVHARIGYVPGEFRLYERMHVRDYLEAFARFVREGKDGRRYRDGHQATLDAEALEAVRERIRQAAVLIAEPGGDSPGGRSPRHHRARYENFSNFPVFLPDPMLRAYRLPDRPFGDQNARRNSGAPRQVDHVIM